jgi:hypothetical protein
MGRRILELIATVMDACAGPPGRGPGHPPAATVRVLATLRRFLREGTPWRSLTATAARPRRAARPCAGAWQDRAEGHHLLQQVHAVLVAMLRGGGQPDDLILDSCSVRAKRAAAISPAPIRRTGASAGRSSTTSPPRATGCRSPARRRRPTSTTRSCSSACS